MYPASTDFHEAAANGAEQKALLIFSDAVFTDMDIAVDVGIEFHEYFNTETDLAIGQANSSEISFTLFNDGRWLNSYGFGEFIAALGVLVDEDTYTPDGTVRVTTGKATYIGYDGDVKLKRDGSAVSSQPDFTPQSMWAYDGKVYVFGSGLDEYAVYNDNNGSLLSVTVPEFMRDNAANRWTGMGMYYKHGSSTNSSSGKFLYVYEGGKKKKYEFVPLGTFIAERPNAPDQIQVEMTCYDRMTKFDVDMPSASDLNMSYPATIGELLTKMCDYFDLTLATQSFINSGASISEEPEDFEDSTMRDVLKWIAEAAASNARFNRDGELELTWLRDTDQTYDASGYSDFSPYWYETASISKLYNRDTAEGTDNTLGDGDEGYLIQDNPLLKGVS